MSCDRKPMSFITWVTFQQRNKLAKIATANISVKKPENSAPTPLSAPVTLQCDTHALCYYGLMYVRCMYASRMLLGYLMHMILSGWYIAYPICGNINSIDTMAVNLISALGATNLVCWCNVNHPVNVARMLTKRGIITNTLNCRKGYNTIQDSGDLSSKWKEEGRKKQKS